MLLLNLKTSLMYFFVIAGEGAAKVRLIEYAKKAI